MTKTLNNGSKVQKPYSNEKKLYQRPQLVDYGDVDEITQKFGLSGGDDIGGAGS